MEAESSEFQDWEVLHHISDAESEPLVEESSDFVGDSGGMIQTNYFSLDFPKEVMVSGNSEELSKNLDNPHWMDPAFEKYPRKHSGGSWSDSSSDRSDYKRFSEFEGKYDVGFVQNDQNVNFLEFEEKLDAGFVQHDHNGNFQEFEEKYDVVFFQNDQNGNFLEFEGKLEVGFVENDQNVNFQEFEGNLDVGFVENDKNVNFEEGVDGVEDMVAKNDKNFGEFSCDCSGVSSGEMIVEGVEGSCELGMEEDVVSGEEKNERDASEGKGDTEVSKVQEKKKKSGMVWWKFPIELLRYCVFKGPVWTVSIAAAFMGFVILGRRLYKMKKKSKALGPKITMDDKKISQFISRAARLNEAFSVVKRVPIIRPSLPAAGVTPWPVVGLR